MSEEPRYVDDPWEEEDNWWKPDDLVNQDLIISAFLSAGRTSKRFRSKSEKNRWKRIDERISNGKLPKAWVQNCIDWAMGRNKQHFPAIAIKFTALTSLILNGARMDDWLSEHPEAATDYLLAEEDWGTSFDDE